MHRMSLVLRRGELEAGPKRCDNFFDQVKKKAQGSRKARSPVARLRQLLMCIGGSSLSSLAGDPTLLERIEAHLRESGDCELQQLVKEYLAEV
jgi:hypothetical protein